VNAAERRIAAYVEQAHQDNIERLIEAWADVQAESLGREILARPCPFYRPEAAA
jgi:hypothetical protein